MQNRTQNQKPGDLQERCLQFSVDLINFLEDLPKNMVTHILMSQIVRAATSIGANVHEAFGSGTKRDFVNFFAIALKSGKETIYWLKLFERTNRGDAQKAQLLIAECQELCRMIAASILTAKGKR